MNILNLSPFGDRYLTESGKGGIKMNRGHDGVTYENKNGAGEKVGKSRSIYLVAFLIIAVLAGGTILIHSIIKERTSPSYLVDKTISSLDNLREEIKRRMLVLEKTNSDSIDFRNLVFIGRELDIVREELINTKKFLESPWNN